MAMRLPRAVQRALSLISRLGRGLKRQRRKARIYLAPF